MKRFAVLALLVLSGCAGGEVATTSQPGTTRPTVEARALDAIGHPVDLGGEGGRRSGCGGPSAEPVEQVARQCVPTLAEGAVIVEVQWADTGSWQTISLRWRES